MTRNLTDTGIMALSQLEVFGVSWYPHSIAMLHDKQQSVIRAATIEKLMRGRYLEEVPDSVVREVLRITELGHAALHDRPDIHNQIRQHRQMQDDLARET